MSGPGLHTIFVVLLSFPDGKTKTEYRQVAKKETKVNPQIYGVTHYRRREVRKGGFLRYDSPREGDGCS